jgi:hypothetical protein
MHFLVWCQYQHTPLCCCSQRGRACISTAGVRLFLSALGCWFVVTLCVAVLLKTICSERYLAELGFWWCYFFMTSVIALSSNKRNWVLLS